MKLTYRLGAVFAAVTALTFLCAGVRADSAMSSSIGEDTASIDYTAPSSPELDKDISALHDAVAAGDFSAYKTLAATLAVKWQTKDVPSYLWLLHQECDDLSGTGLATANLPASHVLCEAYSEQALQHRSDMPLALAADFVEQLNYVPDKASADVNWPQLRSDRAKLWLMTWQEINNRAVPYAEEAKLPAEPPALPDKKYITITNRFVVNNGYVDPANISDLTLRKQYADAWARYRAQYQASRDQEQVRAFSQGFSVEAVRFLVGAYEASPRDFKELKTYLNSYKIDPEERDFIFYVLRLSDEERKASAGTAVNN